MKNKVSNGEIAEFCLEISLLLHAGVGVGDALSLLAEENIERRDLLSDMARQADDGAPLSAILRETGLFPTYVCGLTEVGERTGRTEEALSALAGYYEERVRVERLVRSSLLYPAVMLGLMLVVIGVLLVKVLPIFDDVYAMLGGRLTGAAGSLLALGRWLDKAMPFIWALLAVAAVFAVAVSAMPAFRAKMVLLWEKRFGNRGISRKFSDARISQAMAMGMASGLPPEEAIALAEKLEEGAGRERCMACRTRLDEGESLSAALKGSGILPANQCSLLEMGMRSGVGDASMSHIAQKLSEESEAALEDAVSRVEPALVLLCSLLVGLILLSVMLPLMHIMAAIG